MVKVLVNGINGTMGKEVANLILESKKMHLLGGLDLKPAHNLKYKVFTSVNDFFEKPNVIIDFSVPESTINILPYCIKEHIPMVIATTGFQDSQLKYIKECSKNIPIFHSSNMSFEISLVSSIIAEISKLLPNSEIEIVETHHSNKKDAPSGTALMLANSINSANGNKFSYNFNRPNSNEIRKENEIGFSSIRGGNIVGEHSVLFFNENETLEIKHTAYSRSIFAKGALKAAEFIIQQPNGYYTRVISNV